MTLAVAVDRLMSDAGVPSAMIRPPFSPARDLVRLSNRLHSILAGCVRRPRGNARLGRPLSSKPATCRRRPCATLVVGSSTSNREGKDPFPESRQIFYELKPLRFASGQSVQGLSECQIAETDPFESLHLSFGLGQLPERFPPLLQRSVQALRIPKVR